MGQNPPIYYLKQIKLHFGMFADGVSSRPGMCTKFCVLKLIFPYIAAIYKLKHPLKSDAEIYVIV